MHELVVRNANVATLDPSAGRAASNAVGEAGDAVGEARNTVGAAARKTSRQGAGPGARGAEDAQDVGLRPSHAVAVSGGRITWIGPDDEWDGQGTSGDARVIDAGGNLVTPGYVDAHTHLVYMGDRAFELPLKLAGKGYLDILAAGGGIAHTVGRTRDASVSALTADAMPRLGRMVRNGSTTLEAKSGYALTTQGELRMLEANGRLAEKTGVDIVSTFCGAHAIPEEHKADPDRYVDLVVDEMIPAVAAQGIATYCDVFVEEGVFTIAQGRRIFEAAHRYGIQGRLHADEIVRTGGAELAAAAGCVTADHLLNASDEGIAAMAEAGTTAVLLPTVPITLMDPKWPRARRFLDAGVPVALASDHNPNNPVTDMGLVMQLGCYLLGLTPEQALTAATWNAAATLGRAGEAGCIRVGARADLLVHDVPDVAHLVHEPGRRTVRSVILQGRQQAT